MASSAPSQLPSIVARVRDQGDIVLSVLMASFLIIMVMPLPPLALDMLLAISISGSLLVLLTTFYTANPVRFSIFPMLLLAATLFRLSLNVASTRLILLSGDQGMGAAGNIIRTFGEVVVGGNYVVGLVVFTILVIINFVVITKGAGRVAEVAARFTLDAMPGKQMAVDAELNAGIIDEVEARRRRDNIMREADFYGAMDGASKFIRGDAIAGILITLINVFGGIVIGVVQMDMGLGEAVKLYTILTIGDGLVSQIPALIVSAAAGMLVTRVPSDDDEQSLHGQFGDQLFGSPRAMGLLSVGLMGFMMVPGLRLPFFIMGGLAGVAAWQLGRDKEVETVAAEGAVEEPGERAEPPVEALLKVDPLAIELGVDLISLVDERKGGTLVERIQRIRRQLATDLGMLVPPVHLRDNLRLESGCYRILLRGEEVAKGKVYPRQLLAIDPGDARGQLKGVKGKDPVFGLAAVWIPESLRIKAQSRGYTVVDVPTVLTTHLTELLHQHGHELFGRAQLMGILDRAQESHPKLVDELVPEPLSRSSVLKVFRNLLREGISVRDTVTILEAMADNARRIADPDVLTEFVRQRLSRHITQRYSGADGTIHYISLNPDVESAISSGLHTGDGGNMSLTLSPNDARQILTGLRDVAESYVGNGEVVVLCPPLARGPLRRLTEKVIPRVPVLSPAELLPTVRLEKVGSVSLEPTAG
jgi:flagellar biosynthesis protein FlhA